MSETQRQRMKRRITERDETYIDLGVRVYKSKYSIHDILVQFPLNHKNRAKRRFDGLHKQEMKSHKRQKFIDLPNHQRSFKRRDKREKAIIMLPGRVSKGKAA